jgi:hypothetical protein
LIDLNRDRTSNSDRFLELKHPVSCRHGEYFGHDAIGFLPNGDLIQVSLRNRKIYKYCFTDKPKNTAPWECSQINDIEIPESLYGQVALYCYIYQTKLFLIVDGCEEPMFQFDLLTMNLERQYHGFPYWNINSIIKMNKNQTLLAASNYIYSMENGTLIYECEYYLRCIQW